MPIAFRPFIGLIALGIGVAGLFFVLRADLRRRKLPANMFRMSAFVIAAAIALSAMLAMVEGAPGSGIRFYLAGICIGALAASTAMALRLAHELRVALLSIFDASSCAAALGYAAFGLGTYFIVEPHSRASLISSASGLLIAAFLWRRGKRAIQRPFAPGVIAGEFVALIGFTRSLADAFRLDVQFTFDATAASLVALLVAASGVAITIFARRHFRAIEQVHRIVRHVNHHGSEVQVEYHRPTPECPHPERWRMFDTMTAEVEVLEFLKVLVTTVKPDLVVETGTFLGVSTLYLAEGLKQNGFGKVVTCEPDAEVFAAAQSRFASSGFAEWIESRQVSSLDLDVSGAIDILFTDSLPELREPEVRRFLPFMKPGGLVLMHDASSHLKTVRDAALKLEDEGLISAVLLPTPRGLVIGQKRAERR